VPAGNTVLFSGGIDAVHYVGLDWEASMPTRWNFAGPALSIFLTAATVALSAEFDLEKVEGSEHFKGSAASRSLLERNGFVVTDESFKQIFEPYIESPLPCFITADSTWHTYHVLLEEGVREMEMAEAGNLAEYSAKLVAAVAKLPAGDAARAPLLLHASVGLALIGGAVQDPEPVAIAKRLGAAAGPPVAAPIGFPLAPERFRPVIFYAKSPDLAAYFRARQWFATCDFRLSSAKETLLALRLSVLIEGDPDLAVLHRKLSEPYDVLVGPAEDGDVRTFAAAARKVLGTESPSAADLESGVTKVAEELSVRLPAPRVNDQLLDLAEYRDFPIKIRGFRLLPPRQEPSAVCFQETVDPKVPGRMVPSGIDFMATSPTLASVAAKRALVLEAGEEAAGRILAVRPPSAPASVHGDALKLLAELQKPLPASAPAPLRSEAWADAQLWTQLGAWAEERHTWALHTKLTVLYMGITERPAGFVSPYPDFYRGLGKLAASAAMALSRAGAVKTDPAAAGRKLQDFAALWRKLSDKKSKKRPSEEDFRKMEEASGFIESWASSRGIDSTEQMPKAIEALEAVAARALAGKPTEDDLEVLRRFEGRGEVPGLLGHFAVLCDELATIARKELDEKPLDEMDARFMRSYGIQLAAFHFYRGNSYLDPRDDFPIVVPVFASPIQDETLYAGLSRPEAIYVIVPSQGKMVLHRGAVLSYREFRRNASDPLDDEGWTRAVKAKSAPPPPAFTHSFR
jgi:uncharacterized protein DUF3160